ncbi:MAG: NADH-quinone oxidoreductase subunit C [Candidatus Omnitrophica bacterium]|nr:NADH-quinone oxidoreductase subunit C [Candidatus Omnitrophota bacterium]
MEQNIMQNLVKEFNFLEGNITQPRERRIFLRVGLDKFTNVLDYLMKHFNFTHLCTITGLDEGENLSFIYHLTKEGGILINIKVSVPKENPVIKSIIPYFAGAEIYERELVDLFGAKVEGLPQGNRYPLTDDWPVGQFPLRKDWKQEMLDKKAGENA